MSGNIYWNSGGLHDRGTVGNFWTSTLSSYTYSRRLYFYSTNVNSRNDGSKSNGFTLRCVAQNHPKPPPMFHSNTSSELSSALQILCTFSSRALRSLPLSVMLSGDLHWSSGTLNSRGTLGHFWSSTPYTYARSLSLYFFSTSVNPKDGDYKPDGLTLHCVALTFQNFHPLSKFLFSLHSFFQSSPQPSSFGYVVGLSLLAQW